VFSFALGYAILKIKGDEKGRTLNGLNQLFVYADDIDLIKEDIETLQTNTEVLVEAYDEIGLQVKTERKRN